jgi:hypothetical protein
MAEPVYGATLNQPPQSSTAHSGFTPTPNVAVTIPVVHGRAMEQRLHEIFAHENEAQTVKRQARPDEAIAKTSAPVSAVPEPATISSDTPIQRKEDMLREVQELAQRSATPGANLNAAAAQAEIVKISQRYGELTDVHPEEISSNFEKAYAASYDEKAKTLPWYKRAYYQTRDVVKGGAKLLGDVGSWLADKSASAVKTAASFVKEAVTDPAKTMLESPLPPPPLVIVRLVPLPSGMPLMVTPLLLTAPTCAAVMPVRDAPEPLVESFSDSMVVRLVPRRQYSSA